MSSFMGTAGTGTSGIDTSFRADDIRNWDEFFDHDAELLDIPVDDCWSLDGYRGGWWPGGGGLDATGGEWCAAIWSDRPNYTRGSSGRLGFTGTIRTAYGTAVAGAVVKLYRTVDDSVQSQTTSGADGTYTLSTPYSDAHYIVGYKDDVIDLAGATPTTLIPA